VWVNAIYLVFVPISFNGYGLTSTIKGDPMNIWGRPHVWWMTYWIWLSIFMQFVMMINPWIALPIFLSFPNFHAFWDGSLRTIWNSNFSNMKESNVDERDHMMNLCNNTTTMPKISKWICTWILGQVMDFKLFQLDF
jgi:hypothetical protein